MLKSQIDYQKLKLKENGDFEILLVQLIRGTSGGDNDIFRYLNGS